MGNKWSGALEGLINNNANIIEIGWIFTVCIKGQVNTFSISEDLLHIFPICDSYMNQNYQGPLLKEIWVTFNPIISQFP